MSRPARCVPGGMICHVLHRGVGRRALFDEGRYRCFPVESHDYFYQVVRYVERNPHRPPGPHTYLAFDAPRRLRFLKVVNVSVPADGKFALRDLRVFGRGDGTPPAAVMGLYVRRHQDDDRNATLTWTPATAADGYLLRFGIGPDQLFQTIQRQGRERSRLTTHALNRDVRYAWRIDAFNASGLTPGVVVWPPPTSSRL